MKPKVAVGELGAALLLLTAGSAAWALTPIPVANAGFETPTLAVAASTTNIVAWNPTNVSGGTSIGVWYPTGTDFTSGWPEGYNVAYVRNAVGVQGFGQVLSGTPGLLQRDAIYTLTVLVGNSASYAGFPGYQVQLLAGGTVLAQDDNTLSPAEGGLVTSTVNYTNTLVDSALVGQPLEIRLLSKGQNATAEVEFDNVQLNLTLAHPLANAGGPYKVLPGGSLTLDGSGSLATDGSSLMAWDWDLNNDGIFGDVTGANPAAIGYANLMSSWGMTLGTNTLRLRVTDANSQTSTNSTTVILASPAPELYWDANSTDLGAGGTPTGTWGTDTFWNNDDAGAGAGVFTAATASTNNLYFLAAPSATSGNTAYTVSVSGAQTANSLNFQSSGAPTISDGGGALTLGDGTDGHGGITVPQYAYGTTGQGNPTIGVPIILNNSQTWVVNTSRTLTVGGAVSGSGKVLTKDGAGQVTFTNANNTYSGGTVVNQGTLRFNSAGAIAGSGRNVTVTNGATISAGYPIDNAFLNRLVENTNTFNVNVAATSVNALDFSSGTGASLPNAVLTGAGGLIYGGILTPNGNTFRLGNPATTFGNGNLFSVTNVLAGSGKSLVVSGTGQVVVSAASTYTGATTVQPGAALRMDASLDATGGGPTSRDITVGVGGSFIRSSAAVNNAFLNRLVETTNEFTLYCGNANVGGTLDFSSSHAGAYLPNASLAFYDSAGTKRFYLDASVTPADSTYRFGGQRCANWVNVRNQNVLTGTNGLVVTAGVMRLLVPQDFSGPTLVNAVNSGRLILCDNLAMQNSAIDTAGAGVIDVSGDKTTGSLGTSTPATTPTFGGLKGSKDIVSVFNSSYGAYVTGLTLNPGAGVSNAYSGILADGQPGMTLTKTGAGTQVLSGTNTYSGATAVNAGMLTLDYSTADSSKLSDSAALMLGGGTLNLNGGTHTEVVASTTLNAGVSAVTRSSGSARLALGAITPGAGALVNFGAPNLATTTTPNDASGILGPWAILGDQWAMNDGSGNIVAYSSGYTDIAARGPSTLPDGAYTNVRILNNGSSGAIALGASLTTVNTLLQANANYAATIDTAGKSLAVGGIMVGSGAQDLTIGATVGDGTLTANIASGTLSLVNNSFSRNLTINAAIADNVYGSKLTTAGHVVLNGVNSYSGDTAASGTLELGGAGQLGGGSYYGTISFGSGGSLAYSSSADQTLSGVISGAGSLTKAGTGRLSLAMDNTYSGVTTVSGGVLQLLTAKALPGGLGASGGASALTFNGGILGLGAGNFTRSLAAAGTVRGVNFSGNGGWAAYGGDRLVNLGGAGATISWAAANTGFNGQTLLLGASTADSMVTLQNPIDLGTLMRTVQVNDGTALVDATLSGALSGSGGLLKTGAGTLALSGTNTYTGDTVVSGGTLAISQPTLAASSTVRVAGGAMLELDFAGTNTVASLVLNGVSQPGGVYNSTTAAPYITGLGSVVVVPQLTPPTLVSSGPLSGSSFPLTFSGPSGQSYHVLSSTNVVLPLASWTVLASGTFGASPVTYTNTSATNAQQFYRIQSP